MRGAGEEDSSSSRDQEEEGLFKLKVGKKEKKLESIPGVGSPWTLIP
jgi:hypothetical protein